MDNKKIVIKGARENNLKNIDLEIPRDKLIIMTGLSGSGKTSLAFDTIYAEGQRRYVESLSSYARQFLGGVEKPDVDLIEGLSPSIAIDQKTTNNNPRSTVGTVTEIYDFLRLLFARVGVPYCPTHHNPIIAQSVSQMVERVMKIEDSTRCEILATVAKSQKGTFKDTVEKLIKDGFIRAYIDDELILLEDFKPLEKNKKHTIEVVVDRIVKRSDSKSRLHDSIEIALKLGGGLCVCKTPSERLTFSEKYACPECDFSVPHLEPRLFSFNSPLGACEECNGLGVTLEADVDLIVTDPEKSMSEGCMKYYKNTAKTLNIEWQKMSCLMEDYNIDPNMPWNKLSKKEQKIILVGSDRPIHYHMTTSSGNHYERTEFIEGVQTLIQRRYFETQSKFGKEYYKSYMTESVCHKCHGARLNEVARSVKINKLDIYEFTTMPIDDAYLWINDLELDESRAKIAKMVIDEINNRLRFLVDVGLGYISLDRMAGTLSGGEAQRIRLATQIGSKLQGVLYVLDEPSIGLHQRDNDRLITTLKNMRDLGNTLIVVEHDEDTMRASDFIVDIGPGAGIHGGEVIVAGSPQEVMDCEESITGQYLSGKKEIPTPTHRRKGNGKFIEIKGCKENNLKNINVKFPLGKFVCVTGVSGSGKSTLVNEILAKAIKQSLNRVRVKPGEFKEIKGLENVDKIVEITQDPIGRTPRSNPVTYTGVFDSIRDLFALTAEAKLRGYNKGRFSFNVKGGRCESCQGDGVKRIRMNFLPDVYIPCTECHGKRYNDETLQVSFKGKTIADVLDLSVEEAVVFFANIHKIKSKLQILADVGLGYIKLGQSATTLSGGEAQRVKLASELQKIPTGKTVFILDEPTTGLHTADVKKLLAVLQRIADNGDTVICIEHNLDVIKSADYIIDLGPEGGQNGGTVLAKGTPEKIMKVENSYTGKYLKKHLNRNMVK